MDLSPQDLLAISQAISREFAPRYAALKRGDPAIKFCAQELLTISQEITREFAPRPAANQTRLVLLPVAPRRLHAYWHVADKPANVKKQPPDSVSHLTLRIFPQPEQSVQTLDNPQVPSWFDIVVDYPQGQQDVILPESGMSDAGAYGAAIGETREEDQRFTPFAYSNIALNPQPRQNEDRLAVSGAMMQFIMPAVKLSSSTGKNASGQGK